jgi:DNA transformation protein
LTEADLDRAIVPFYARRMSVSADYLDYVLEQLAGLGGLTTRRMFGGVGLYHGDLFFALIDDDTLYFKVDDSNRTDYQSRGARPFRPYKDRPEVSLTYFEVPAEIMEEHDDIVAWARRSIAVALSSQARKNRKTPSAQKKRVSSKSAKRKRAATRR